MKNKVNFHTHTYRCKHAVGNEEDYVIEAINHIDVNMQLEMKKIM